MRPVGEFSEHVNHALGVARFCGMKRMGQTGEVYAWRSHDGSWRALVLGVRTDDKVWGDDMWMARLDLRTSGPPTASDIASSQLLLGDAPPRLAPGIVDGSHVPWWLVPIAMNGLPDSQFSVEALTESWQEWSAFPTTCSTMRFSNRRRGENITLPRG